MTRQIKDQVDIFGAAEGSFDPLGAAVAAQANAEAFSQGNFANPTATAGSTAVNGSATTGMRSDAAPAVQVATSSLLGILRPDNVTITISGGVISASPATAFANPTAVASDTAVNGSATTAMRSDAAPAVQKATTSVFGIVKADGTTITVSGGVIMAVQPAGANPSASVSLAAVNGSAATFMRSDAAPPLDQSISPTWSGSHVFSNPVLFPLGSLSAPALAFSGHATSGWFYDGTNLGIGYTWAGVQIGFLGVSAGGTTAFSLFGNSTVNNQIATYNSTPGVAPTFTLRHGSGTVAAPALDVAGNQIGRISWQPLTATTPTFTNAMQLQGILTETATVSSSKCGMQARLLICPVGSGALTEVIRFDNESGLSMFGANPVVDKNRLLVLRAFATASLPTGVNPYSTAFVTDATLGLSAGLGLAPIGGGTNKVPVYTTDGTNWLIG